MSASVSILTRELLNYVLPLMAESNPIVRWLQWGNTPWHSKRAIERNHTPTGEDFINGMVIEHAAIIAFEQQWCALTAEANQA